MAALDFPSSPTVGQQYSASNGGIYKWDGAAWALGGPASGQPAGGDLSGTYPNPLINGTYPLSLSMGARVSRSTAQSIPNTTYTTLVFDTVVFNQGGMWSAGAQDRLTVKQAGTYLFGAAVVLNGNATGSRRITNLLRNGIISVSDERQTLSAGFPGFVPVAMDLCNVNDYLQVQVYQDSGAALNAQAGQLLLWACRIF